MKFFNKKILARDYQSYILTLLIISGPIKPLFNRFILNIDITLIAFAIAGCDLLYQLGNKFKFSKKNFTYVLALFLLFALMIISLLYTSSEKYSFNKLISFGLVIFCFVYASVVKKINLKVYLNSVYYIVIPLSFWFIYYRQFFWSVANAKSRSYEDGFYYALGSYLGLGYLLSLGAFILVERKKWYILIFIFLVQLALGARGPLLLSLVTILIVNYKKIFVNLINYKFKIKKLIAFAIGLLSATIIFIYKFDFIKDKIYRYGFDRFISLFSSDREDLSANNRIEVISFAIESIFTNPITFLFGNGIGSFGFDFTGEDIKHNPHNIFLESWYELGILGFTLIVFFLITPLFQKRNTLYFSFVFFALLDCLKSNNLSGIWILAILYAIYINNTNTLTKVNMVRNEN